MRKILLMFLMMSFLFVNAQEAKVSMEFPGVSLDVFLKWFVNFTNKKIIYGNLGANITQKKYILSLQNLFQR